jgi:hypothetical protein
VKTVEATLTSWSGKTVQRTSEFDITADGNGAACPSPAPFAPTFTAGTLAPQAGAFSPFTLTFARSDADQALGGLTVQTPPGLLGVLKSVQQCPAANWITSSTFNSVPDAPISSFDLTLPEGAHSVLATNLPAKVKGSLCGIAMKMPTTITGQNGAVLTQATKVALTGCAKAKKAAKRHRHSKK